MFEVFKVSVLILLFTSPAFAIGIRWRKSRSGNVFLAANCDFVGNTFNTLKTTADQCLALCEGIQRCNHFSWAPTNRGTCYLKTGNYFIEDAKYRNFPKNLLCGYLDFPDIQPKWIEQGKTAISCGFRTKTLEILDIQYIPSDQCKLSCLDTEGCTHYFYKEASETCELRGGDVFKDSVFASQIKDTYCGITNVQATQPDDPKVTSGSRPEEPEWHMIIGGKNVNDLSSVELYNWKTGEQCLLEDLPVAVRVHSGTVFQGVPMICGGFVSEEPSNECFKYDRVSKTWLKASDLLLMVAAGTSNILVPHKGWFLFGGEGEDLARSQKLTHPDAEWELGPDLFQSKMANGQCLVQYSDSQTVFLGGSEDNYGIVTLDWDKVKYTKHKERLSGKRWKSACANMKGPQGEHLVAVAGGLHKTSQGMEIWNPMTKTVTTMSSLLPNEKKRSFGLNHAQLIPINGGSELLLYGGWQGNYQGTIWKFTAADSSWSKHGSLIQSREEHVVLPVEGIVCESNKK